MNTNPMRDYFKPSVVNLRPYTSARDESEGLDGIFLDANENSHDFEYRRYPDPYQKELKIAISKWREVDPSMIFLGNGSDEIIDLLIRSTCHPNRDRILSLNPSYGMYKVCADINEIPLDFVNLNPDFTLDLSSFLAKLEDNHKLIFLCSPNNPNGGILDPKSVEAILLHSSGLVIVDEAYIDFADAPSWISRLSEFPNLIVLQTFSKSLGAAGIRLGMAFMNKDLIHYLNKVKPPYNVSQANQDAAQKRLEKIKDIQEAIEEVKSEKNRLARALKKMDVVLNVYPSEANFLLVKMKKGIDVFLELKERGIVVRNRSNQLHCEDSLRITIGTKEENNLLIAALADI